VRTVFSKFATVQGRAQRSEYWWFVLFSFIVSIILSLFDNAILGGSLLGSLWSLAVLVPSICVGVRRLHDIGKSGWWLLIIFIPLIGLLVLIWFTATKGTPGPNQFGPDPLAIGTAY
ncbi:MAG: DUF805 domain-containing protein, partial [Paracoccaceae bacterium]|nr:DUF805 domain-containing protein [Paracoccaceae bacterium]